MNRTSYLFYWLALVVFVVGCTSEKEPLPDLCENPPELSLVATSTASCNQNDGSLTAVGTGGTGNLLYSIDGGPGQASTTFNDLAAGSYLIAVTDDNGCFSDLQVSIVNEDGLNANFIIVDTECEENLGSILVQVSGAMGHVQYKLNEGGFQNSNSFANLPQGGYTVTVRDNTGCEIEQEVDIKTDATFGDVELIIQNNCTIDGCHDGSQTPDLRGANNIIGNASLIKQRTGNRTMPTGGGSLTDEEIATIACWVDDGASGN